MKDQTSNGTTPDGSPALASGSCSADRLQPSISYEAWLALGPEKAAEYIALRMDLSAYRQEKLALILKTWWKESPPKVGLRVEGPQLWLARRNGVCRGVYGPHRIEYRAEFYRVNGKPVCETCWRTVKEAQHNEKLRRDGQLTHE